MYRVTSVVRRSGGRRATVAGRGSSLEAVARAQRWLASWAQSHSTNGNPPPDHRLAIVLSGGATRGAFQVGVIDVLARRGIVPDLLVGTSVGAINAAYWAFHPDPDVGPRLLQIWRDAARAGVLPHRPLRIVGNLIASRLHERRSLARILERELPGGSRIESAWLPLHVVACNLRTGAAVDLDRGPAVPALLASAAVPGVFPPVVIDGEPLADGGLVANCPIDVARRAGATDVLAIDLVGESPWVPAGGFSALERAVTVSLANQTARELELLGSALRIAVLRPRFGPVPAFGNFSQTVLLYRHGQLAAERFIAEHWVGGQQVNPGTMEFEAPGPLPGVGPARRLRPRVPRGVEGHASPDREGTTREIDRDQGRLRALRGPRRARAAR